MAPQTAKSLMKDFRASFRRKKTVVDPKPKENIVKEANEEELAKLAELKENMKDDLPPTYTDAELLGFLRARFLNVKETERLVKMDENLKKFLRISDYKPPEEYYQYSMCAVFGFDKDGCVVRLINVGGVDVKGLMNMVSTIEFFQIVLRMIQNDTDMQREQNKKTGKKNIQFLYIIDLENMTMNQVTYKPAFDSAMQALKLLQDHYQDALKAIYLINAPIFFSSVYKLFRPVIQDSLHEKIKIFNYDNYKENLLKEIDADVLPKYLGGNRVDSNGDPNCSEFINFGCTVPESCYATNFLDTDDPEVVVATVPAGATLNFRYPIRKVGTVVHWHIQAKDNDIGVGLFREPFPSGSETPRTQSRKKREEDMSKYEQLTPIIRSQCHIRPEESSSVIWFTGIVILHFDNTYSWMNSKEVYFKVTLSPPSGNVKNSNNSADHTNKAMNKMATKN